MSAAQQSVKLSKAEQRSVSCNAFSIGLIKQGFGLIKQVFLLQE